MRVTAVTPDNNLLKANATAMLSRCFVDCISHTYKGPKKNIIKITFGIAITSERLTLSNSSYHFELVENEGRRRCMKLESGGKSKQVLSHIMHDC